MYICDLSHDLVTLHAFRSRWAEQKAYFKHVGQYQEAHPTLVTQCRLGNCQTLSTNQKPARDQGDRSECAGLGGVRHYFSSPSGRESSHWRAECHSSRAHGDFKSWKHFPFINHNANVRPHLSRNPEAVYENWSIVAGIHILTDIF